MQMPSVAAVPRKEKKDANSSKDAKIMKQHILLYSLR